MANPILHIKDAYFFEVPKFLLPSNKTLPSEFPDVWLKLDPDVQRVEALEMANNNNLVPRLSAEQSVQKWESWSHQDGNHGAPYDVFFAAKGHGSIPQDVHMQAEETAIARADEFAQQWKQDGRLEWYNHHISGKILIPQPFAELRNLHEAESGFAISKFMVIELAVAIIIFVLFSRLAKKIATGEPVRGRFANFLETFLIFVRDEISRPSIGSDADFHHGHDDHHNDGDAPLTYKKADALTPIFWTMFLFITGCNLFGLVPWAGSPTAVLGVTFALAIAVFLTSLIAGSIMHGPVGFWIAQLPSMDLSFSIGLFIKPMLWIIEIIGLFIKHGVLAVRLLANMVAGHIVLLSIMGMATLAAGNLFFLIAPVTIIGAVCIGLLELFVAFLQAYVFTLLSALFIGAAMHHH